MKQKIALILLFSTSLLISRSVSAQFFAVTGNQFDGKEYDYFDLTVNSRNLEKLTIEDNDQNLSHSEIVKKFPNDFLFTTTFFNENCVPMGLFIKNSKINSPVNIDADPNKGNFFLQPNGALLLSEKDAAIEVTANLVNFQSTKTGFQSGPILISGSAINSNLNSNSSNFKSRSAVGIYEEASGIQHLVFVISRNDVSFYQIANFLKTQFNCKSALGLVSINCALNLPFQNSRLTEEENRKCCRYLRFVAEP